MDIGARIKPILLPLSKNLILRLCVWHKHKGFMTQIVKTQWVLLRYCSHGTRVKVSSTNMVGDQKGSISILEINSDTYITKSLKICS